MNYENKSLNIFNIDITVSPSNLNAKIIIAIENVICHQDQEIDGKLI
tara:strand:+ start:100749 stop:100889 length:141 start_codon:yes stop_codon:yes gene_type:complete